MKMKIKSYLVACILFAIFCVIFFGVGANGLVTAENAKVEKITIKVDTLTYSQRSLPNGLKGQTYPLFDYTAVDNLGNDANNKQVIVYNPNGDLVVTNNDRFATEITGDYKIEYTASSGSITETVVLKFTVIDETDYVEMNYQVNPDIINEGKCGDIIYTPLYEDPTGGLGDVNLDFYIEYMGPYSCDKVEIEDVGNGLQFVPEVAGEYILNYKLTDVVGKEKIINDCSIVVKDSVKPIMDVPALSPIAFVGEDYILPSVDAKVYYEGRIIYIPVEVMINGQAITEHGKYLPTEKNDFVVTYKCVNPFDNSGEEIYSYTVKAVDKNEQKPDNYMLVSDYLLLDGFSAHYRNRLQTQQGQEPNVMLLSCAGNNNTASMRFKNRIHKDYLEVVIGSEPSNTNYTGINIWFTDSNNAQEKILISINIDSNGVLTLYANDKVVGVLEGKEFLNTTTTDFNKLTLSVGIDSDLRQIIIDDKVVYSLNTCSNGKLFNGFSSGYAYMGIELVGINGESSLKLKEIAKMAVSDDSEDISPPYIIYPKNYSVRSNIEFGDKVVVEKLEAYDVLNDDITVTATVYAPDNTVLFSGTMTEDLFYEANQYGGYYVIYKISDGTDMKTSVTKTITVVDRNAPTMSDINLPAEVKLGSVIEIPQPTVVDNVDDSCTTWVIVERSNYDTIMISGESYKFERLGEHIFTFYAQDSTGNYISKTYVVNCVK